MKTKKHLTDAITEINIWNKHLSPEIRKEKYNKMARSPYYFFRGTNHLFWKYFAMDKRLDVFNTDNSSTWIQGDLHAYNYGIYCDADDNLVYDLNDFDESCIANYQFDLWRMASSMVLIARENKFTDIEFSYSIIDSFTDNYIKILKKYTKKGGKILKPVHKQNAYGKLDETIEKVEKENSRKDMLKKWTISSNGVMQFDLSYEKLKALPKEKKHEIEKMFEKYTNLILRNTDLEKDYFHILDIAYRVSSGTGSYGTPRYYILIKGNTNKQYGQRILDVKLQTKPTPYIFLNEEFKQQYDKLFENEGVRHAKAYKALNYYVDKHLSWLELTEGVFSVRERSPFKSYFQTKTLNSKGRFRKIAEQWGSILATSHIKSNDKFDVEKLFKVIENNKREFQYLTKSVAVEFADYNDEVYTKFVDTVFL